MDKELFQSFSSHDLTARIGRLSHTGRSINRTVPAEQVRNTILYLQRRLRKVISNTPPKIWRQVRNKPAAEAMVVDTPNGSSRIEFGSNKFVDQLIQVFFVHEYIPDLYPTLLADNPAFCAELNLRVQGLPRNEAPTRREPEFTKVVWYLSQMGPRALGGRKMRGALEKLRIKFSVPKRPKKAVFRRGYNDHGSLAPEDTKTRRQVDGEFFDLISELYSLARESVNDRFQLSFHWDDIEGMHLIRETRDKGYEFDDDWCCDLDKIARFHDLVDLTLIRFKELSGNLVARELNQIARRG